MVLGIERINVRRRSPNPLINFITPLKGPDEAVAQDYLERIAAIVYPIMRDNNLAVMTLEEFPANREFWGRNFNAGEIIQLVLKHPQTGQWLPFRFVEGTMLHELAHNKEMNHSRFFWRHKNAFSTAMSALHTRNYTGEGFWSAGRTLDSSAPFITAPAFDPTAPNLPPQICGGTYRSRNRRRGRPKKPPLTAEERQEQKRRRIEKKFGSAEGVKVGADEEMRMKLEDDGKGKGKMAAPRVAGSKRGRELRAAAALKRFEQQQVEAKEKVKDEEEDVKIKKQEDSEGEYDESTADEEEEGVNVGGGKFMVEVSKKEDGEEEIKELGKEMKAMAGLMAAERAQQGPKSQPMDSSISIPSETTNNRNSATTSFQPRLPKTSKQIKLEISDSEDDAPLPRAQTKKSRLPTTTNPPSRPPHTSSSSSTATTSTTHPRISASDPSPSSCPVCTTTIAPSSSIVCPTCMNVLHPELDPNAWACSGGSCPPAYRNSGDVMFCGLCGERKRGK